MRRHDIVGQNDRPDSYRVCVRFDETGHHRFALEIDLDGLSRIVVDRIRLFSGIDNLAFPHQHRFDILGLVTLHRDDVTAVVECLVGHLGFLRHQRRHAGRSQQPRCQYFGNASFQMDPLMVDIRLYNNHCVFLLKTGPARVLPVFTLASPDSYALMPL